MSFKEAQIGNIKCRIMRISFTGEHSYEINIQANYGEDLWKKCMEAGKEFNITPYGTETMHLLRAEKGFIIVGQDTDATMTPIDLQMDWIVSKKKYDFIGKRSLYRSDTMKEERKQLVGLLTDDPNIVLEEGAQIVSDLNQSPVNMLGHVTSSYYSPNLKKSIALAVVRGGKNMMGKKLFIPMEDKTVEESTDSSLVDEIVKHLAFYYDTPTQDEIFRVVKTFEPNDEARDDLYQEVLDEMGFIEEDAELANAPDEKYADTDTLVNKISGGLNRRKKAYAKAENGDNPMAVTESEEELTTRLLKEYDEFKVTAPADSEEGNWEIENVGKWAVKIGNTENVEATDGELDLPFDTDLASALADEAMAEAEDTDLVEDDVEEGLRMEFPDGSCEGSKCPDDRNRRKKPKKLDTDTDALDDEMSEDKK